MPLDLFILLAQTPTPTEPLPPSAGVPLGGLLSAVALVVVITLVQIFMNLRAKPAPKDEETDS